jgi:hypothetical protein
MRNILMLCAATLWLPMAGCGGSGQNNDPVPADAFPARFATAWCGLLQRCCLVSGGTAFGSCEADAVARLTNIGTEAAADGATWNGAVAARCLGDIAGADCATADGLTLRTLLDACDDTWTGVIPPGGSCQTYASCAEPQVTGGASGGASCVNSMCVQVVRLPPGAACSGTTATCDPLLATCVSGACVALPGAGEACTDGCRTGLRCSAGVCAPLLAVGQSCSSDNECASDRCSGTRCASIFAADGEYCTLP